jgi:hypothetical protein
MNMVRYETIVVFVKHIVNFQFIFYMSIELSNIPFLNVKL